MASARVSNGAALEPSPPPAAPGSTNTPTASSMSSETPSQPFDCWSPGSSGAPGNTVASTSLQSGRRLQPAVGETPSPSKSTHATVGGTGQLVVTAAENGTSTP